MATHLQKPGSDVNAWGLVHNDYHKTTLGGYEYIDIQLNANNPPTIKQYSRFSVYKTDNSYTIPNGTATGNNNYPMNTTPTYNLSQAIFEDGADVTFTWAGSVRGETIATQSDGTWYIYCKNCLDTDATTKGQGVYNVSKTETPTFSIQKGGWYSANGYRVLGQFTSASGTVSALYIYRANTPFERGLYNSKGIYADATNVYFYPYEIEVNGKVYSSTAATTVQAWSGLSASTWYCLVMSEATGALSVVAAGSGWTGYTISGNQLNLMSIYDAGYGYCRSLRSGVWFRVLGVFYSNATPNAFSYVKNIKNKPLSSIRCTSSNGGTSFGTGSTVIINFENIIYDTNSEVTAGASWKITSAGSKTFLCSVKHLLASDTGWGAGETALMEEYLNGASVKVLDRFFMAAALNPALVGNQGSFAQPMDDADYFDIRLTQASGNTIASFNNALHCWITAEEIAI